MSESSQKEIVETYDASKAPFSWDKLDGLLAHKSSLKICAEILDCHENTIKDHIKKRYGETFTEYAERKLSKTKVKLVQTALEMAFKKDRVMLIFCLKNLCHWQDKIETDFADKGVNIQINYTKDAS